MNELEEAAWFIAENAHLNQMYGDNDPYINHVKRVFERVSQASFNREINRVARLVAILHDVVEDSDVSFEEIAEVFGDRVKNAVWFMTRNKEKETYFEYISRLKNNDVAILVKTCDLIENLKHSYLDLKKHSDKVERYEKALAILSVK